MWNLNRVNGLSFSSKMLIEMMSFTNKKFMKAHCLHRFMCRERERERERERASCFSRPDCFSSETGHKPGAMGAEILC